MLLIYFISVYCHLLKLENIIFFQNLIPSNNSIFLTNEKHLLLLLDVTEKWVKKLPKEVCYDIYMILNKSVIKSVMLIELFINILSLARDNKSNIHSEYFQSKFMEMLNQFENNVNNFEMINELVLMINRRYSGK
ncbi:hypothetical protein TUBRATIS_13390 [Tubulinosema ratisbonensis]|uniref:Uncharacterized protein n=1 Tax=Tubulinosema ratisbonensis TaxID=291195 RepID=A0A437AM43_9MICR|nr:hypothetical protein TUBRATIS_13390 [Tubulinosema ratisbonensis]